MIFIAVTLGAHIRKNSRLWDAMSIVVQDTVKTLKKHVLTCKISFRRMLGDTMFFGITLRCGKIWNQKKNLTQSQFREYVSWNNWIGERSLSSIIEERSSKVSDRLLGLLT